MNAPELPPGLSDRGIGFQAVGFTIVGCITVAILQIYSGSDHWLYKTFEITTTKAHWAFILPLAALFDKVRTMFATRKEIREAVRRKIRAEVRQEVRAEVRQEVRAEGREEGREEVIALLERRGVTIPPEIAAEIERLLEDES